MSDCHSFRKQSVNAQLPASVCGGLFRASTTHFNSMKIEMNESKFKSKIHDFFYLIFMNPQFLFTNRQHIHYAIAKELAKGAAHAKQQSILAQMIADVL